MRVECPHCKQVYNIPEERLPKEEEIAFPCPSCKGVISIQRQSIDSLPTKRGESKAPPNAPSDEKVEGEALKQRILRTVNDLPPMPQTVIRAQEIIRDPNSSFEELAKVLETDQAVGAKVLKLANSPYYGMMGKVSSLQHASVVLGQKTLEELITVAGTANMLGGELEGYELATGDFWMHSMGVAVGSKLIAEKKHPAMANDAFAAGLIHDVGKLALNNYVYERKAEFKAFMKAGQGSFTTAEKQILGLDHSEIAFELCRAWNVPKQLRRAIRYHHVPTDSDGNPLAFIVHTADALAMMSGMGAGIDGMQYHVDEEALNFLRLQEEEVGEIITGLVESVQEISVDMEAA